MAETISGNGEGTSVRWYRTAAIGFSLVFLIFAAWAAWRNHFWPSQTDYVSFWASGRLALSGEPSLAYDIAAHHAAEQAAGHVTKLLPFPYPPAFLAVVSPFALLPYGPSFYFWIAASGSLYAWSATRVAPLAYAFAIPPGYINYLSGQTGFLTSGIFIAGLSMIEASPWYAGAILGFLVLKPQLALLLPVAMLAGCEWRVITGAIVSASALLMVSLFLFGWSTWQAFFGILPHYVEFMQTGFWPWNLLASPFALARSAGLSQTVALSIHSAVAILAAVATGRAWWLRLDTRVPILAAATLLVPPYLLTYDTVLLVVPMVWLIREGRGRSAAALAWLCCLCPVLSRFSSVVWPNLTPLAAVICLWALHAKAPALRRLSPARSAAADVSPA
jgi:alpha-1,2-mannosyltransferase